MKSIESEKAKDTSREVTRFSVLTLLFVILLALFYM